MITLAQASEVFQSVFGRAPNASEVSNFQLALAANNPALVSQSALENYLKSTPDYQIYAATLPVATPTPTTTPAPTTTPKPTSSPSTGLLDAAKPISISQAAEVFYGLFGRQPSQNELSNFNAAIAANNPVLSSETSFYNYLRNTPEYQTYVNSLLSMQSQVLGKPSTGTTTTTTTAPTTTPAPTGTPAPTSAPGVPINDVQASAVFQSVFGRVPNATELANFRGYQQGTTPFTSADALTTYLMSTPDYAFYKANQALPPETYGKAVVPQAQLQYGYGPEQGLLTNIKGPTGQQIQNYMDAFYAASYGGTPTAGLLAPRVAANQVTLPASFYAMPQGAPTAQQLAATGQGLLNTGATFNDLRAEAQKSNLSPQVTGSILSTLNQGASLPYVQGLLSGTLPLVAGENLLAYK